MAAVEQDITAEQGAALAVTLTGAGASLNGRTLRMHVRSKVGVITTKLVASTSDGRLTVGADPYTTAALAIGSDIMAAVSVTLPVEYWTYDVESYTSATDVRREWSGRFTITRDVTRDTEADEEDSLAGLVRYDTPQSLTTAQKLEARTNIGAGTGSGSGVDDGDKGDITVSGTGAVWTIDANAVTFAKMQAVSANVLLGNDATGTAVEEITCTAAGRALLDDADASAQRTTLGLGTAATQATGAFEAAGAISTHNGVTTAHGISAFGATLVDDADAATARTTLGLGTAATSASGDFAAASHNHAASAITSGTLVHERGGLEADVSAYSGLVKIAAGATSAVTVTAAGEALLDDADAAAQRATLGLVIGTNVQAYDADLDTWAGVTPGTGIATALAVNVGSAGAPVVNGGALGTPSSGNLGSCTFPTLNQNTTGYAEALKSATTTVSVSAATAPSSGQVLTATSSTAATWQTPSGATLSSNTFTGAQTVSQAVAAATTLGLKLASTTAATVGAQKWSPALDFEGSGWKTNATAAAQTVNWRMEMRPVQGTAAPSASMVMGYQVNGGGYTDVATFSSPVFGAPALTMVNGVDTLTIGALGSYTSQIYANYYLKFSTPAGGSFFSGPSIGTAPGASDPNSLNVSRYGLWFGRHASMTVISPYAADPMHIKAETHTSDEITSALAITAQAAYASAATNITGGAVALTGGAGASASAGAANGGAVTLDGGQGYGTGAHGNVVVGNTRGKLQLKAYAVASLGSATPAGMRAFANDANATTFHSVVAGGGANFVPVFSDGTDWRIG